MLDGMERARKDVIYLSSETEKWCNVLKRINEVALFLEERGLVLSGP